MRTPPPSNASFPDAPMASVVYPYNNDDNDSTASSRTQHRTRPKRSSYTLCFLSSFISHPTQHQYKIKVASVQASPEYTETSSSSSPRAEKTPFCTSRSDLHHPEFSVSSPLPPPPVKRVGQSQRLPPGFTGPLGGVTGRDVPGAAPPCWFTPA